MSLLACALRLRAAAAVLILAFTTAGLSIPEFGEGGAPDPEPLIEVEQANAADQQISERIRSIFAQIPALADLSVTANAGVVRLAGEVASDDEAQRAVELVTRLAGVVTVVDEIERSLGVEQNLGPLMEGLYDNATRALEAAPLVLVSLLLLALVSAAGHWVAGREALWRRIATNAFLADLLAQAFRIAAIALGVILALNLLGASTVIGTVLGGAGILTLAVGFAIRDTLENYISSIMLSLRQPFRANDRVRIDDYEGTVMRLTSRATVLMTPEGNQLRIPNATVFKGVILNFTRNPERRFEFELGVDAADDPLAAMASGLESVRAIDSVLENPKPRAFIKTVGDSNIVICFMAWVDQREVDFRKVRSVAIRSAMRVLETQGFTLPEPIYRLRFDEAGKLGTSLGVSLHETTKEAANEDDETHDRPARKHQRPAPEAASAEVDLSADDDLQDLIEEERQDTQAPDLLDPSAPTE